MLVRLAVRYFFHNSRRTSQATLTLMVGLLTFLSTVFMIRGYSYELVSISSVLAESDRIIILEKDTTFTSSIITTEMINLFQSYVNISSKIEAYSIQKYFNASFTFSESNLTYFLNLRCLVFDNFRSVTRFSLAHDSNSIDEGKILAGDQAARIFGLYPGLQLNISVAGIEKIAEVQDILYSDEGYSSELIANYSFVPTSDNHASIIEIKINDPKYANEVVDDLSSLFPTLDVSYQQKTKLFFEILSEEFIQTLWILQAGFFILMLFSIAYTMLVLINESEKDIHIFHSLGFNHFQIAFIFIIQAAMIGLFGSILALVISLLIVNGIIAAISTVAGLPFIVVRFDPLTSLLVIILSIIVSTASGLIPSIKATQIKSSKKQLRLFRR
jgi:ABC-type lipoprotein release transport system permease subunit